MDKSLIERLKEATIVFLPFGYISFGGPNAHIALLHNSIVSKYKWVDDKTFSELFSICQALPGPASTELAYSLGLVYGGFIVAIWVFILWSIPMFIVMTIMGITLSNVSDIPLWATRLSQGLASSAIGLVALAAYKLFNTNAQDKITKFILMISTSIAIMYSAAWLYPVLMITGGITTYIIYLLKNVKKENQDVLTENINNGNENNSIIETTINTENKEIRLRRINNQDNNEENNNDEEINNTGPNMYTYSAKIGMIFFIIWFILLIISILVRIKLIKILSIEVFSTFYFVGSIIFGGGPVVIPLLQSYTVDSGWVTNNEFVIGLALIQSLPGPNFNFAAYLGAIALGKNIENGIIGAILGYIGIFLPGLLLKNAIIPFWQIIRSHKFVNSIFKGVNASATGLVFSSIWILWLQINISGGSSSFHIVIAFISLILCEHFKIQAPLVIIIGGIMGIIEWTISK